jgi:Tfp pilus assembly protein PilF
MDQSRGNILEDYIFEYRLRLGRLLARAGRFDDAVDHLDKLLEEQKDDQRRAYLLRSLSMVYQQQERPDLARERLREAYALAPSDVGLNNDLGYTLADAGVELDEAERMIRLAVGEAPRVSAYLDSLGWVLYKKGEFADACMWLKRAAALQEGQDAVIFDHLGDVLWKLEQRHEARSSWRRALEVYEQQLVRGDIDPDDRIPTRVRGKLEAARTGSAPAVTLPAVEPQP